MVFVLVMTVAVLLSLIFLYKTGRLTADKMEVQNAADAAAYSVSVTEARDLNFMSYTNRAMVANEVGIAQMVGLVSWADHIRSVGDWIRAYDLMLSPATLGISSTILQPMAGVFTSVGSALQGILTPVARFAVTFLSNMNKAYGVTQYGYHVVTVAFSLNALFEMIQQNAPGAKLSDFGFMTLVAHVASYHGLFTKTYAPTGAKTGSSYSKKQKPAKKIDPSAACEAVMTDKDTGQCGSEGFERLSAIIRDSRDPFSTERGWALEFLDETVNFDVGPVSGTIEAFMDLNRRGGTELRFSKKSYGQNYGWSAGDLTAFRFGFGLDAALDLGVAMMSIDGDLGISAPDTLSLDGCVKIDLGLFSINVCLSDLGFTPRLPFPTTAPFSSGGAQTAKVLNQQTPLSMTYNPYLPDSLSPVTKDMYGGAPGTSAKGWNGLPLMALPPTPPPPPLGGVIYRASIPTNNVNTSYSGLQRYTDTQDPGDTAYGVPGMYGIPGLTFAAPYILVGVVKDIEKVNEGIVTSAGRFELQDKLADEEVAAIARAEVYFARPNDLAFFAREDGAKELGSAFNPYWQARLVKPNDVERMVAIGVQQKQPWVAGYLPQALNAIKDFGDLLRQAGLLP